MHVLLCAVIFVIHLIEMMRKVSENLLWIFFLMLNNFYVLCISYMEAESSLQRSLLSSYNVNVRPTLNGSEKTDIYYTFYIKSIHSFTESTGKFSITGLVVFFWRDPRISWSTSDPPYDVISSTSFKAQEVWAPNFVLANSFGQYRKLGAGDNFVNFNSSGGADMYIGDLFETTCLSDVTLYPFDSQKCHMEIAPWSVEGSNMRFISLTTQISLQVFTQNGMWELDEAITYVSKDYGFEQIVFTLHFHRRALYQTVLFVIPPCVLSLIPSLVFFIPVKSGERLGFSITSLLSLLLYQTAIASRLPESSLPGLSVLILKTFAEFLLGCIILVMAVFSIRWYHNDETRAIPKGLLLIHRIFSSKNQIINIDDKEENGRELGESRKEIADHKKRVSWQDASQCFDIFCISFSTVAFVCINVVFVIIFCT